MEQLEIFDMEPEQIVKFLQELYIHYSSLGKNSSTSNMSTTNLLQFFNDCQLSKQLINKTNLDLIIITEKRHKKAINFEVFLDILSSVSKAVYPDLIDSSDAVYYFLDKHALSLYKNFEAEIPAIQAIDQGTIEIILQISSMLQNIYKNEFTWEIYNNFDLISVQEQSKKKMMKIVMSLKIAPDLIALPKCAKIWKLILYHDDYIENCEFDLPDLGHVFTFKHFMIYLLYCCKESNINGELSLCERFSYFFHHIEAWLESSQIKFCLLKVPELVQQLQGYQQKLDRSDLETINTADYYLQDILEDLETIFHLYSTWVRKIRKHCLSLQKFIQLLTDSGMLKDPVLDKIFDKKQAEIIFLKLARGKKNPNQTGKLSFSQFFKAIEEISIKIYDSTQKSSTEAPISALGRTMKNYLERLKENTYESQIKGMIPTLRNSNLADSLSYLSQAICPFAKFYMSESGLFDFELFIKFCRDFSIFPEMLPLSKLTPIFYTFAMQYAKNTMMLTGTKSLEKIWLPEDHYVEPEFINYELLLECLAICALERQVINKNPAEKINFMVEKITQSQGAAEISLKTGFTRSSQLEKCDFLSFMKPNEQKNEKKDNFVQLLFKRIHFK